MDVGKSITEESFVAKRLGRLVYLAAVTLIGGALLGAAHRLPLGDILALVFADMLYAALFIFYLESCRLHHADGPDSAEDYQRICSYYTTAASAMIFMSFCPDYTAPVLAVSFLLAAGLDREQAVIISLFFDVQLALCGLASVHVLSCYVLLTLLGAMLTVMYSSKKLRRYAEMITLSLSIAAPVLFYYLEHGVPEARLFLLTFISGTISVIGMHYLYDGLNFRFKNSTSISLDTIVDPNYHLIKEIRKYSQVGYNHAVRVSRIAAHCAATVGADVKLTAVGGFYYRIGKLGGEPFIENGVRIAHNNCFPNEIVKILSEYNGELHAISTIESAIIHITDTLVAKFELLDQTVLSNAWNRDMVIYQTLNDNSASGVYDSSGLTMNQFLKIREFLAKEEKLL